MSTRRVEEVVAVEPLHVPDEVDGRGLAASVVPESPTGEVMVLLTRLDGIGERPLAAQADLLDGVRRALDGLLVRPTSPPAPPSTPRPPTSG